MPKIWKVVIYDQPGDMFYPRVIHREESVHEQLQPRGLGDVWAAYPTHGGVRCFSTSSTGPTINTIPYTYFYILEFIIGILYNL